MFKRFTTLSFVLLSFIALCLCSTAKTPNEQKLLAKLRYKVVSADLSKNQNQLALSSEFVFKKKRFGKLELRAFPLMRRLHTWSIAQGFSSSPKFSPDGRLLAIGCVDGKVRIWNVSTGKIQHILDVTPFTYQALCLDFLPNSGQLIIGCGDWAGSYTPKGKLLEWNLFTSEVSTHEPDQNTGYYKSAVTAVAVSSNVKNVAWGYRSWGEDHVGSYHFQRWSRNVIVGNIRFKELPNELYRSGSLDTDDRVEPMSMTFTPDNRFLVLATGQQIFVWNIQNITTPPITFETEAYYVKVRNGVLTLPTKPLSIDVSNDSKKIVVGAERGFLYWCNLISKEKRRTRPHQENILLVKFLSQTLLTVSADGTVKQISL